MYPRAATLNALINAGFLIRGSGWSFELSDARECPTEGPDLTCPEHGPAAKPIEITDDAAAYIRQLQDEKAELEAEATKWHDRAREAATEVGELQERNARLKRRVGDFQELVRMLQAEKGEWIDRCDRLRHELAAYEGEAVFGGDGRP